jgi:hypothetical protein
MYPGMDMQSKMKKKNKKKDKKKNKKKKMNVFETEVQMKEDLQALPSSEHQPLEEDTELPVQGSSR